MTNEVMKGLDIPLDSIEELTGFNNETPVRDLLGYAGNVYLDEPVRNGSTDQFDEYIARVRSVSGEAARRICCVVHSLAFRWRDGRPISEVSISTIGGSRGDILEGKLREYDGFGRNPEGDINFEIAKRLLGLK